MAVDIIKAIAYMVYVRVHIIFGMQTIIVKFYKFKFDNNIVVNKKPRHE